MSAAAIAVRPETDSALPSVSADALEAAADLLLAAAGIAAAVDHDEEPDPDPAVAVIPARPRRRGPGELTPAQAATRNAMIADNVRLVRYVANSMARVASQSALLDYDDLLSYGTEGLITAVDTFDVERGLKFSTWAVMHIRTTIQDALRTLDPLPRSLRAKGKEIERVSAALAQANGAWPNPAQLAEALGQSVENVRRTLADLGHTQVSLDQGEESHNGAATGGDEGGVTLLNIIADDDPEGSPEERLDQIELSRMLNDAINALPPREEILVDAHYRQGQSMRTISRMLGVSESRVSQLHARAIRLLREHLHRELYSEPVVSRRPVAVRPMRLSQRRQPYERAIAPRRLAA